MDEIKTQALAVEVEERVDLAYTMLIEGMTQAEIVRHMLTLDYGLTSRQLRNYVHKAQAALAEEARKIDRRAELAKALARYERQYKKCDQKSDERGAMMAQDRIVALLNLSIAAALDVKWENELKDATDEEIKEVVVHLLQEGRRAG